MVGVEFSWAMKNTRIICWIEILLPNYIGIVIGQYKDPYKPTSPSLPKSSSHAFWGGVWTPHRDLLRRCLGAILTRYDWKTRVRVIYFLCSTWGNDPICKYLWDGLKPPTKRYLVLTVAQLNDPRNSKNNQRTIGPLKPPRHGLSKRRFIVILP